MSKRKSWYDQGFDEARDALPADPPWEAGHRDHDNYMDGYRDGELQAERDARKEAHEDDED